MKNNIKGIKTGKHKWELDLEGGEAHNSEKTKEWKDTPKYTPVDESQEIQMLGHGLFAERDTIEEAKDWFYTMLDTVDDKESKYAMMIAFNVFWNTLANNYRIFEKEKTNE
tara:strand:- start:9 stop:341 length:333 start_codon:yes stop_codon:yes gene_type:complete